MSRGWNPYWDRQAKVGSAGEQFVDEVHRAIREDSAGLEVKTDVAFLRYGNFYVEHEQFHEDARGWVPSGIQITKAGLWSIAFGRPTAEITLPTYFVREACRPYWDRQDPRRLREQRWSDHHTRGVILPATDLLKDLAGRFTERQLKRETAMSLPADLPDRTGMEYFTDGGRATCRACGLPCRSRDENGPCHPTCATYRDDRDYNLVLLSALTALRVGGAPATKTEP